MIDQELLEKDEINKKDQKGYNNSIKSKKKKETKISSGLIRVLAKIPHQNQNSQEELKTPIFSKLSPRKDVAGAKV